MNSSPYPNLEFFGHNGSSMDEDVFLGVTVADDPVSVLNAEPLHRPEQTLCKQRFCIANWVT